MISYRITKYDPRLRDKQGSYEPDEWTSVLDIGKQYPSGILNVRDYLSTEDLYVDSVLYLWQLAKCPALFVTSLESNALKHAKRRLLACCPELLKVADQPIPLNDQELQDPVLLARVVRLILRELIWCKLQAKKQFFIHFGWDYYMYCGGVELDTEARLAITDMGLFVEPFRSPY